MRLSEWRWLQHANRALCTTVAAFPLNLTFSPGEKEFTAHDPLTLAGKGTTRVGDYSSTLLRPSRSRQLRRRSGVPTEVGSPESGFDSVEVLSGGGFGVDRPLFVPFVVPPEEVVPPTRLRVGVLLMPEPLLPLEGALEGASRFGPLSTGAPASARSTALLAAGLRLREPVPLPPDPEPEGAGRRVRLAAEAGLRELDRREVAAFVAALSSPFGDAASSETSGREDADDAKPRDDLGLPSGTQIQVSRWKRSGTKGSCVSFRAGGLRDCGRCVSQPCRLTRRACRIGTRHRSR